MHIDYYGLMEKRKSLPDLFEVLLGLSHRTLSRKIGIGAEVLGIIHHAINRNVI